MKTYSKASDELESIIERIRLEYHSPSLDDVRVDGLFIFDDEEQKQVLTHGGYPATAMIHITNVKHRVLGVGDAVITVDRFYWLGIGTKERDALIDHELYHLDRFLDEDDGTPVFDVLGRPKISMRQHDHQMGWFDAIAQRHGDSSPEIRQAKKLIESTHQLYFDFGRLPAVASESRQARAVTAAEVAEKASTVIRPEDEETPHVRRLAKATQLHHGLTEIGMIVSLAHVQNLSIEQTEQAEKWLSEWIDATPKKRPNRPHYLPLFDPVDKRKEKSCATAH